MKFKAFVMFCLLCLALCQLSQAIAEDNTVEKTEPKKRLTFTVKRNHLKTMFENNRAIIYALIIRTFNATDQNGDDLIEPDRGERVGSFISAIDRLDELKKLGINTVHVLPFFPPGKTDALGVAGSLYSPTDLLTIDPKLDDVDNPLTVYEEAKLFVKECHKRDIKVMLDVPCCASVDLFEKEPDLFVVDKKGSPVIPADWTDIRTFKPLKRKNVLNEKLYLLHEKLIDMCLDLGIDGIRADVARMKPDLFWQKLISHTRCKDPEFGFLAESFSNENISTAQNVPPDRADALLFDGFDAIYGQYNNFKNWQTASEFHKNVETMLKNLNKAGNKKTLIGSFTTHDERSPMLIGGVGFYKLITALQCVLPRTNPYFVSGFESGDNYTYSYANKPAEKSDTDSHNYFVHPGRIDIFNYSRKPGGNHPEIGEFVLKMLQFREQYSDVLLTDFYKPVSVIENPDDKIIAFIRCSGNHILLFTANMDLNRSQSGTINMQMFKDGIDYEFTPIEILPGNSASTRKQQLKLTLAPGSVYAVEIKAKTGENCCNSL